MTNACTGSHDPAELNEARLEALLQLSRMTESPLQAITDFALEHAVMLTRSSIGYLAFVNDQETVLTMHSWSRNAMAQCAILDRPIVYPLETTGLWGEALRQRRPIITNDYVAPGPLKRGLPVGHVPIFRHMNVPVFDQDHVVAVAGVGNKNDPYDASDVRQLTLLIDGMWRLIQQQRREAELKAHRFQLEQLVAGRTAELASANCALAEANQRLEIEIAERRRAEAALREEEDDLRRLLAMHDQDRKLIGYEIHDGLAQFLAVALMQLESYRHSCGAGEITEQELLTASLAMLRESLQESRRLIHGLHSEALENAGLIAAIEEHVEQTSQRGDAPTVEFVHDVEFDRLPPPLENTIFRMVHEGLNNACRHSKSPRVRVSLIQREQWLHIVIEDWGVGFDPEVVRPGHFGLESIRQRARLFGGMAQIESTRGAGSRVVVAIPLTAQPVNRGFRCNQGSADSDPASLVE